MWEDRKQTNSFNTANNPNIDPPVTPVRTAAASPRVAVIGKNMLIIGHVKSSEDVYVDGEVRGTLELENSRLTIGPSGKATAGAKARDVEIMGRIDGDVESAEKISIRKGGQLVGDIRAAGIVIEDGAYFKGSIDIVRRAPDARESPPKEMPQEIKKSA
jgi:cytoskeletal protein CcmA (bactofilin family)